MQAGAESENQGLWADYKDSLRYFRNSSALALPYTIQMLIMVLLILVPYTHEVLGADARAFAAYEILYSVGAIAGGVFSPVLCRALQLQNALALLLGLLTLCLLILSVNKAIWLVFPVYFLIGAGLAGWALSVSLSQMVCAQEYQGRMQASFNGISGAFILLIYLTMAAEGSGASPQLIYAVFAAIATAGGLAALFCKAENLAETEGSGG